MLLAGPYLYAASICTTILDHGGPGWLNILVLLFIWNALKMLWIGPISLVLLARVRVREYRERRDMRWGSEADQNEPAFAGIGA